MIRGILRMPWIDLLDEFEELDKHESWKACDIKIIKRYLEEELHALRQLKEAEDNDESTF
jgi:hypothetical protein